MAFDIGSLISGLLGFGGGLLSPKPQQKQSFAGTGADPTAHMTQFYKLANDLLAAKAKQAGKGVQLRGTAPSVPGLSESDPALKDPSLLNYAGLDTSQLLSDLGQGSGGSGGSFNGPNPPPGQGGGKLGADPNDAQASADDPEAALEARVRRRNPQVENS